MGTKFAPTYATLVMGFLEEKLYQQVENEFGFEFADFIQNSWKRFLDDCFIIWTKSEEQLERFTEILNNLHNSIKFTRETNSTCLPFLDVLVINKGGVISTDIFYKSTDTHQYLSFKSCHPTHTKRNIPYCLARKICTVISDENTRNKRLQELEMFLTKQKYPESLIKHGIQRAKEIPRNELMATNIVITHNPCNTNIFQIARSNLPIIAQSEPLKVHINEDKIIQSKRQSKNLKRLLTKARFDPMRNEHNLTVSKCNDKRCGTCNYIHTGHSITAKNGTTIYTNADMDCKTSNLIYCIKCSNCEEIYIGQTGDRVADRMRVHRQQIREPAYRQIPLSEHLETCSGGFFKIFPFYKMKTNDENLRKLKEKNFILKFKPLLNGRL